MPPSGAPAPGKVKGTIVALGSKGAMNSAKNRQNHESEDDSAPDHADRALPKQKDRPERRREARAEPGERLCLRRSCAARALI